MVRYTGGLLGELAEVRAEQAAFLEAVADADAVMASGPFSPASTTCSCGLTTAKTRAATTLIANSTTHLRSDVFGADPNKKGWAVLQPALPAYKAHVDEDINAMGTFVVPADGDNGKWPEETWGLKLGSALANIKPTRTFAPPSPLPK
jgi:hypothetical protein